MPRVVWVEESKNGLKFEIGPNHDDVPTRAQLLTDRQSSCKKINLERKRATAKNARLRDILTIKKMTRDALWWLHVRMRKTMEKAREQGTIGQLM